jgi:putative ABC transport system permease protein
VVATLASAALARRPLRSSLTALGIAIAIASTIVFLSLGEGLRAAFSNELSGIGPDLQVSYGDFAVNNFGGIPELPLALVEAIAADAERYGIRSLIPLLLHVRSGLNPGSSVVFQGIPAGGAIDNVYQGVAIGQGRGLSSEDAGRQVAVLGSQAAERAGVEIGGTIRLNPRTSFEVIGVLEGGGGLLDNTIVVPLDTLQEALSIPDRVSFLVIALETPSRANAVAEAISADYPELGVTTRTELLTVLERGIAISDVVRLGISAIALIVGAIAVANTMLMSVFERTREFGVVRAVGARPRFLFGLVLLEAIVLSLIGAILGVGLGFLGAIAVNAVALDLIAIEVAVVTPRLVAFAVAVAAGMGLLAGLLPAARAARVSIAVAVARD